MYSYITGSNWTLPTISLKKMVTESYISGSTIWPFDSLSATEGGKICHSKKKKHLYLEVNQQVKHCNTLTNNFIEAASDMHAACGQSGHVITWWSKFSSALLAASSSLVRSATFSSRWLAYDSSTSIIESITPEVMTSWLFHNGFVCIYDDARSEV